MVDALASRGEFYTSYTPYQPEVSQGNLQAMFEYQTLICQLTGMDVSNASLYDGGSAAVEAVLLCMSATRRYAQSRHRRQRAPGVSPDPGDVPGEPRLRTGHASTRPTGVWTRRRWRPSLDDQAACVLLQHPELLRLPGRRAGDRRRRRTTPARCWSVSFDPISLGPAEAARAIWAPTSWWPKASRWAARMQFGGPYLGIMACREKFVRRMPGRIAGQTVDRRGRRCWVLTLQTREQHIRREKATSNICTNQGLFALRAAIYLASWGRTGCAKWPSCACGRRTTPPQRITAHDRFERRFAQPTFKEFVIRDTQGQVAELLAEALDAGILAGVPLGRWYPRTGRLLPGDGHREANAERKSTSLAELPGRRTAAEHGDDPCVTLKPPNCSSNCPNRAAAARSCPPAMCRRRQLARAAAGRGAGRQPAAAAGTWPSRTWCGTSPICRR